MSAQETPEQDGSDDVPVGEHVEEPAKLLRIAHMVRSTLDEVKTTELDEAGRRRLAELLNRSRDALAEVVSDDLSDELREVTERLADDVPSGPELRVAQAQLAGWLEGLFRGIQASLAARQKGGGPLESGGGRPAALDAGDGDGRAGQYL